MLVMSSLLYHLQTKRTTNTSIGECYSAGMAAVYIYFFERIIQLVYFLDTLRQNV